MIKVLVFSFAASVVLTWPTILLARHLGICDRPSSLNWHAETTPLLGGLPILIAFAAGLFFVGARTSSVLLFSIPLVISAVVGLWDDVQALSPAPKLLGLLPGAVSVCLLWPEPMAIYAAVLFVIFFLFLTNAVNLLDNIDGLTAAMSAVSAAGIAIMAGYDGMTGLSFGASALCGASLGFLLFNYRPWATAAIFLGDMGAFIIGAGLAIGCAFLMRGAQSALDYGACLLPVGLVMFDTVTTVWARKAKGDRALSRSLDHISQRLYRSGIARWKVTIIMAAITAAASAAAVGVWVAANPAVESLALAGGLLPIFGLAAYAYTRPLTDE